MMIVPNRHTEEADFQALARALQWEAVSPKPWRALSGSSGLHMFLIVIYFSRVPYFSGEGMHSALAATAMPVFVPAKTELSVPPRTDRNPALSSYGAAAVPAPSIISPDVAVDFSALRISFAPDLRNELPQVVRNWHGSFALLDKQDRMIAHYLIRPPGWDVVDDISDVSRSFQILMDPPEKWTVLRAVASRTGIDLHRYQAAALFDSTFRRCLKEAILTKASTLSHASGEVATARLAIAPAGPCGIEVLEVSLARR